MKSATNDMHRYKRNRKPLKLAVSKLKTTRAKPLHKIFAYCSLIWSNQPVQSTTNHVLYERTVCYCTDPKHIMQSIIYTQGKVNFSSNSYFQWCLMCNKNYFLF